MVKSWLVLEVQSPSAEHVAVLTEGLIALGADAVIETGDWLSTWLPAHNTDEIVVRARNELGRIVGEDIELRWSIREDQDWSEQWKAGLKARRVSERIVVVPSWVDFDANAGDIVLTIDPQMAFGTGEHASTRGALRLIEASLRAGDCVLDVGTGSAILAVAAALLGASRVDAVEHDATALINARENVERHGCAGRVILQEAFVDLDYLAGTATASGRYDLIAGNVLSSVLVALLSGFRTALRDGGSLVLAGIMTHEADGVIEAASAHGFRLVREDRDEEWWGGLFAR